jgi:CheY-like chemotaxis protein
MLGVAVGYNNERGSMAENVPPVILVVDDDPGILETVVEVLELEGYRVLQARNGYEAFSHVLSAPPDLILLDLRMPVMHGWEFAQHFRERWGRTTPIVAMTADVNAAAATEYIIADAVLAKPFSLDTLTTMVANLLKRTPEA